MWRVANSDPLWLSSDFEQIPDFIQIHYNFT